MMFARHMTRLYVKMSYTADAVKPQVKKVRIFFWKSDELSIILCVKLDLVMVLNGKLFILNYISRYLLPSKSGIVTEVICCLQEVTLDECWIKRRVLAPSHQKDEQKKTLMCRSLQ